ncbi:hypothetical protein L5G32_18055 [Gordonia sp. HY002]|uniref:hypothetical protein n=1 Tax=Gordonia zhenghanii TaxID=2911516 RepID=UPI001EEFAB4A|nr:hypothetical protein [Gordonia zhenghanii]MCF8572166.1 hypothetical protein [Gordonia zhenghanii]MCF8606368.1 hypothetical protein [Gordonia zhenghanii]
MLKTMGRGVRTFMRALDTASAIRHGTTPKHYDDVREPVATIPTGTIEQSETPWPVAA